MRAFPKNWKELPFHTSSSKTYRSTLEDRLSAHRNDATFSTMSETVFVAMERPQKNNGALRRPARRVAEGMMMEKQCGIFHDCDRTDTDKKLQTMLVLAHHSHLIQCSRDTVSTVFYSSRRSISKKARPNGA